MSHTIDLPVAYHYRGKEVFLKFDWDKPNDESPVAAHVLEEGSVVGLASTVADLTGPWNDYQSALTEAKVAAERWIDSQMPSVHPA